jgi:hypothetical protein
VAARLAGLCTVDPVARGLSGSWTSTPVGTRTLQSAPGFCTAVRMVDARWFPEAGRESWAP